MSQSLEGLIGKRELVFLGCKVKPLHHISSAQQIGEIGIVHFLQMMKTHGNYIIYENSQTFFKVFFFLIYFWLCQVFIAAHGLSLVAASRSYSLLRCAGFSLRWLLLLRSTGSRRAGLSSCNTQAQ